MRRGRRRSALTGGLIVFVVLLGLIVFDEIRRPPVSFGPGPVTYWCYDWPGMPNPHEVKDGKHPEVPCAQYQVDYWIRSPKPIASGWWCFGGNVLAQPQTEWSLDRNNVPNDRPCRQEEVDVWINGKSWPPA